MRWSDLVSGLLLTIAGIVTIAWVIPDQIGSRSFGGLPPDFFPRILAWLFLGLAILLVASRAVAMWRRMPSTESAEPPLGWRQAAFIAGASAYLIIVYQLMEHVNFVAAAIFAVAGAGAAMGSLRSNPIRLVLISLLGPVAVYYAFRYLFLVFLPA